MIPTSALVAVVGAIGAAAVDARTGYLPNVLTRGTALAALALAVPNGVVPAAAGGCIAGGALLGLYVLTRGRGLGLGDVKLATAIGAGLTPVHSLVALGTAFVIGGGYAAVLIARGRAGRHDAIAFGPFLAAGAVIATALLWTGATP
jgi:leader peptidase (prepilin peptidase)/N-methyltransferase